MEEKKWMVSVVIPNWNGKKYLRECLKSLEKQDFQNFEIIVVDNGSEDGSVDMMKKEFPRVKILRMKKNEGFCRAVNIGIRAAKAPYVLLVNNELCRNDICKRNAQRNQTSEKLFFLSGKR